MTVQMDLFAPVVERFSVEPTSAVIVHGAKAAGVPRHTFVPAPRPDSMHSDEEWLTVLEVAEEQIRYKNWTRPHPLPLDEKPADCEGGYYSDRLQCEYSSGKGVCLIDPEWSSRCVKWPVLLRGLRAQREQEPHIADARDLAAAYRAHETYDRYFVRDGGSVPGRNDGFRERVAIPHLARLRQIIIDLGGDPDLEAA